MIPLAQRIEKFAESCDTGQPQVLRHRPTATMVSASGS
jgi:hypothetical protein